MHICSGKGHKRKGVENGKVHSITAVTEEKSIQYVSIILCVRKNLML